MSNNQNLLVPSKAGAHALQPNLVNHVRMSVINMDNLNIMYILTSDFFQKTINTF